nr:cytoplasmic dynein 2 heavy chain 1-like [Lepeophtheirus salmonis]
MSDAIRDNRVSSLLKISSIKSILNSTIDRLEKCQRSLNEFLEEKRSLFPRFYFIGDEDLLAILGQASKPEVIQNHLRKLFSGVHSATFTQDYGSITAINSLEGEEVTLLNAIQISNQAEVWLTLLSREIVHTLRQLLSECLFDSINKGSSSQKGHEMDPLKYPSQVLCLSDSILFTKKTEESIRKRNLESYLRSLKEQLNSYTSVKLRGEDDAEEESSNVVLELKLKVLILEKINSISIVENLISQNVDSVDHWEWQKRLRYYHSHDDKSVSVAMADAEFEYTFEYQGNAQKLVHTPLTEKCYLTLTQAMKIGLGGNPYGPAGTGKTESVKALGGLFGRQVLVFNCDEGIDITSMGRIFIGLIKCGAWGCFDEFNRLEEQTLSAVSMLIQPIQFALKSKDRRVHLMDKEVELSLNTGIFVTMNPAGKGYGGRQKLPDNLKQLFRPVAMSKPDNELIAEITLYSEGFQDAKNLGHKLVNVFNMSEKLLSKQHHYDWGLRALKTVLKGCGSTLQRCGGLSEAEIIVSVLRLNTMSKLTFHDTNRFNGLVGDIFTNVNIKQEEDEELKGAILQSISEMGLNCNDTQVSKVIELKEQLKQRMGVVVVGPSGSGKTTILKILLRSLTKLGQKIIKHTINPKAIHRNKLLGYTDLDTREWNNGVLTKAAIQAVNEPVETTSWIVLDGDIDPEWVESLNSVLDDNRLLTLPSGWRIQFGPNVNFIFETHNLIYASPATISRLGIIFLSDDDANVKLLVSSWLRTHKTEEDQRSKSASRLIDELFFKALDWIVKKNEYLICTSLIGTVLNGLSYLTDNGALIQNRTKFGVGLIRGFGGNLNESCKEVFTKEVLSWIGESSSSLKYNTIYYNESSDRIESYLILDSESLNLGPSFSLPLIHTPEVQFTISQVKDALLRNEPFLLVGPECSGKSIILQYAFDRMRSTVVATIHCYANITPKDVVHKLSQSCISLSSSNGSKIFRPKEAEKLILYFKNLNTVKPDKYGTSMIISFLMQIYTYGGFYEEDSLEWINLEGILIVASMSPGTGWGRHALTERFTSIVRIISISLPSNEYLNHVYNSYLSEILQDFDDHKTKKLTGSMISLYEGIKKIFSSENQNHYRLTPKDLTHWCKGLSRYECKNVSDIIEAWHHEAKRIFRDRLSSSEDISKFDSALRRTLNSDWRGEKFNDEENFFISSGNSLTRISFSDLESLIKKGILTFSRENRNIQETVIIRELMDLVSKVDRVLSCSGGSLLLVGKPGVGRRTSVSIFSALRQIKLLTVRNGNLKTFKSDIKAAMQSAGLDNEETLLLLEDHNFNENPEYLDIINGLLSCGEVPGLYPDEEMEPFLPVLRTNASNEGYSKNMYSYFAKQVRNNLHIVIIMDDSNSNFKSNCENNPALLKECQVQWVSDWSEASLSIIPNKLIDIDDANLPSHFVSIHSMNPNNTPRNYISFIQAYKYIYEREKDKIILRKSKLSTGVHKLMEAKEVVEKLKEEAAIQEKELAEKQREANEALQMITDTMRNANLQKGEMEDLRVQTLEKEKNINERKKVIEIEMIEIKPLIEEAKRAVGDIKSSTLSEVRSLRAPPEVIRDILEGVLRLMGIQDTSWNSMKNFLAKRGVKDEILSFDARRISSKNRVIVENLLQQKQNSFDPKTAKRASEAAAPLASWVLANVKFSYILEKIKPLEAEQMKLHRNLKMAEDQIGELSTGLNEVDKQVAVLKERLNKFTKEAAEVEIHLDKTKETISIADGLVQGLQGEFDRWNSEVKLMEKSLDQLPHLSLIASAFVTYLTNAPEDIRKDMLESWCSALNFDKGEFDFTRFLSGEREMLEWRSQGLPSDVHSIENAISILLLSRLSTPYLIDPNYRATEWLKTYLAKTDTIEVTTQSDERFLLTLELAVRFGKTLIIQDASNISPVLYPLLRADIFGTSPYQVVKLQDKIVDYNDNFKLFLTTKIKSSEIPPDALSIVNMVNFTTTVSGLTGQLLALALQFEKPELEERKSELLKKEEEQKIEVGHLEDSLLEKLASSTGNILDNTELLRSLQETQEKSSAITSSLLEAQFLQDNLDREGNAYLTLAEFASQLYFSIKDLSKLNSMYRFSLSAYIRLYQKTLSVALYKDSGSERRIEALKRSLQDMVFKYVTRSLFNSDRVSFALHLVNKMHPELFGFLEWEEFLGINLQKGDHVTLTSLPEWIDEDQKVHVERLKNNLPQIYETLTLDDLSLWSSFAKSQHCEEDFPVHLVKKITPFQQLLVIQALRPDRLYRAMEIFVAKALKFKELVPPAIILNDIYEESISSEPILILITPGSDPSDELRELAKSHNKTLKEISMGQGQSELALIELSKYADEGQWIVLKNLHLMTYWIPELEKTLRNIKIHEDFRLWLTSESHPRFSPSLSESCLKVAYESPPGIKRNLIRTLSQWGRDKFSKNGLYSQAVFVLSWFHAIIQERRLYIPQGWCKFYEFSDGDSKSALGILDRIQESDNIKKEWNYVRGLLRDAIYGGRVDNSHDMIILNSYLETMFNTDIISVNQNMMRTKRHLATLPSLGPLTSLPSSTDPAQYWNIIHDLQDDDSPSSFGLPNNINRSYQRTASQLVESQLRALVRNSLSSHFERDKWQSELSPLLGLWKQLNKNGSHLLQMKMRHPVYVEKQDPMVSFVQFESYNGTIVLQTIHKTLSSLSKVLRGTLLIDDSISKLANSLLNRCTPYEWQNKWSGPLDPTEYMRISVRKAHKILEWKNKCENGSFFQDELDLSSLFNPDTFLGALRQWKSRLSGLSMQSLQFHVNWSQGLETEEGAVRVSGVMMEGASFDGLRLIENNHESPISSNSPSCSFTWVQKECVTGRRDAISLPLYDNYMREKIIGHIRVPCGDDRDKWLQAGVVFFLKRE